MSNILFPREQLNRDRFRRLSIVEKLVFLHLYLYGEGNAIGIFVYPADEYCGFFPMDEHELVDTLRSLDGSGLIKYYRETNTVRIKGFSKHHIAIFTHKNYFKGAEAALRKISYDKELVEQWSLENLELLKSSPMRDKYEKVLGFKLDSLRPQTSSRDQDFAHRLRVQRESEKTRRLTRETSELSDEEGDDHESNEGDEGDTQ